MSSLTDILTATKNAVVAINNLSQTWMGIVGSTAKTAISASTVVKSTSGRIARISVTTAGTTVGIVYDANATGITTSPIFSIPNTLGIIDVSLPVYNGIVVVPGSGQVVTISYS